MSTDVKRNSSSPGEPTVCARGLRKQFGDLKAVDGLDLDLRQGEIFGLLGPNGAGKSTTINLLCGLLPPDGGEIDLFGQRAVFGDGTLRRRVGVCPQEIVIWGKLTCLEQLEFLGEMHGMRRQDARRRGQGLLKDLGLEGKSGKLGSTLSGGMQRRLNLALALIHDPDLLILDEPEAGLDPQSRVLVRDYIRSLAGGKSVLFTTHNMDEAERVCDCLAIIDHGRLLSLDTPTGLKKRHGSGQTLEIELAATTDPQQALEIFTDSGLAVKVLNHRLIVQGTELSLRLASILETLKRRDLPYREFRIRDNTLEDVFIALTGRSLRE